MGGERPRDGLPGERAPIGRATQRWLVAGLGNPGPGYAGNRHNVGFMVADLLAGRIGSGFKRDRSRAQAATGRLSGLPVIVAKPTSFMNLSGPQLVALAGFYKIPADRIVVIHDDLDLPFGTIRLKHGGGDGGHNGLKSVTRALGSRDYSRVRIGIGRPAGRQDPADYVLSNFGSAERKELPLTIELAADAVEALLRSGLAAAQNEIHALGTRPGADRPA